MLFLETAVGNPVQREQDQVARYREQFNLMLARCLRDADVIALLRALARDPS